MMNLQLNWGDRCYARNSAGKILKCYYQLPANTNSEHYVCDGWGRRFLATRKPPKTVGMPIPLVRFVLISGAEK